MKVVRNMILCLIALAAISGCRDTEPDVAATGLISFSGRPDSRQTRGTPVTTTQEIPGMVVYGYYTGNGAGGNWDASVGNASPAFLNGITVTNRDDRWSPEYPVYWPTTPGANLSFFAYSPAADSQNGITVTSTTGIPAFSYTVPERCADQPDLMVSALLKDMNGENNPGVLFTLRHALTCIGFKAYGDGDKITGIRLTQVLTSGDLTVSEDGTPVWDTTGSSRGTFEAIVDEDVTPDEHTQVVNTREGYLMMIPQQLSEGATLVVSIEGREDAVFNLDGMNWKAGDRINYTFGIMQDAVILLSPEQITLPAAGGFSQFEVFTEHSKREVVWSIGTSDDWMFLCDNLDDLRAWSESRIPASAIRNLDGSVPSDVISGITAEAEYPVDGKTTLFLFVPGVNPDLYADKTGSIAVVGNDHAPRIEVRQLPARLPKDVPVAALRDAYIGAFWRSEQSGERIIRIPVIPDQSGKWSASVLWADSNWPLSGIFFSNEQSEDSGITGDAATESPADMNDPASDSRYRLRKYYSSAYGTVSGVDEIRFRIGLDGAFNPSKMTPARYAVILLRYNDLNLSHLIYLRQGEDPDYLFGPTDPYGNMPGIVGRPAAVRFSPYNLTAPWWEGGSDIADHPALPLYGGIFTDYPSQAGAYFQWANEYEPRRAFHPVNPVGVIRSWQNNSPDGYWDELCGQHETAPSGYRRPTDGATDTGVASVGIYPGNVVDSEFRQSLFLNPPRGNTSNTANLRWGYYADGFFDRRQITDAPGSMATTRSAVSKNNAAIAYVGGLFVNPVTNASIFFPATGYRLFRDGSLQSAGFYGNYWSASANDGSHAWFLDIDNVLMQPYFSFRDFGFTIRCVRDER